MEVEILFRPSSSVANVLLETGESIQVESGAMVAMSPTLEMETQATGGLLKSFSRSAFGGESFFFNTFTAKKNDERIVLSPPLPGDLTVIEMQGRSILVHSGSYMASSSGIEIDTKWSGAKGFFAGEGFVMLQVSGTGTLILSSFGAIQSLWLKGGEKMIVDTGHLVAFDQQMSYQVKKVAGWKSTLFSGEGLVVEIAGPGQLYLQGRSQDSFLAWLLSSLPDMFYKLFDRDG